MAKFQPYTRPGKSLDAHSLRGLAHPLRVRILSILNVDGPSTSTALAERLEVRTGTTSWHLQKLAEHGFIEEIPERGNKRERWWQATVSGFSHNAAEFMADQELAGPVMTLMVAQLNLEFQRAASFVGEDWSHEWRESFIFNSWDDLFLSPEKLASMRDEIRALVHRYRDQSDEDDPNAEMVAMQVQGYPYRKGNQQ